MFLFNLLADAETPLSNLPSLGAAGLMGAMWLWERRTNQKREAQLDEAHARIMSDRVLLDELMRVVKQNTEAITRLMQTSAGGSKTT